MTQMDTTGYANLPDSLFEPLRKEERPAEESLRSTRTYWQDAWRRFRKNKLAVIGLIIIAIITLFAIFGPIFSKFSYEQQDLSSGGQWPSAAHWFGTDKFGRDIFVRCMYGARISLSIGFAAAAINMVIGVIYGGISGYFGGKLDVLMMSICEILYSMPQVCYVIIIMLFMGNTVASVLVSICVIYWIKTARIVRSEVMRLKNEEFVLAARVIGESTPRIIRKHLIPNCMGSIIVSVTFLIPEAIFLEAFLSFLGIGISVPMASWGTLANDAIPAMLTKPYQMLFPALLISLTMFALNFIGDGLRDALDPKMK